VGKLAYFFTTFVGAVPAGFGLYLLIMNFLNRADSLGTMLMVITVTATICMALVVLTPFMVLVFYKDTRPKLAAAGAGAAGAAAGAAAAAASEPAGFDDAIPDGFDEKELAASAGDDDEEYGDYEGEDYTDDEGDYDEDDYDDFEDLDI